MADGIQARGGLRSESFSWDVFGFWENGCFMPLLIRSKYRRFFINQKKSATIFNENPAPTGLGYAHNMS